MKEFYQQKIKTAEEMIEELGFSELSSSAMQIAVRLGSRKILNLHGADENQLKTTLKAEAGMTPVTEADKQSAEIIKKFLNKKYPNDSINEEESGFHEGSDRTWHIDPLDGTSSFAREQRYSTVGISVYENGKPQAAAICHPFEKELLVAEAGKGAYLFQLDEKLLVTGNPEKIEISKNESLENGIVYIDALFNKLTTPRKLELINKLVEMANGRLGIRMTGSNIDQQRQVALGRAEATITDAIGGFYDISAGGLIIEEAGGKFCDINGIPVNEKTQVALGGNKEIIDKILPLIADIYKDYNGFR